MIQSRRRFVDSKLTVFGEVEGSLVKTGHHHHVNDVWEDEMVISSISIVKSYIRILLNDMLKS